MKNSIPEILSSISFWEDKDDKTIEVVLMIRDNVKVVESCVVPDPRGSCATYLIRLLTRLQIQGTHFS